MNARDLKGHDRGAPATSLPHITYRDCTLISILHALPDYYFSYLLFFVAFSLLKFSFEAPCRGSVKPWR